MVDLMYFFFFSDLKGRNGRLQMEKSELECLHVPEWWWNQKRSRDTFGFSAAAAHCLWHQTVRNLFHSSDETSPPLCALIHLQHQEESWCYLFFFFLIHFDLVDPQLAMPDSNTNSMSTYKHWSSRQLWINTVSNPLWSKSVRNRHLVTVDRTASIYPP